MIPMTGVAADAGSLVRLLQFGDSMLPVGGFAFSQGLESAVQARLVVDAASLEGYVRTMLAQAAQADGVGLVHAHRAASIGDLAALLHIDRELFARKLSDEARAMSVKMGAKLAQLSADVTGLPLATAWHARVAAGEARGSWPVALAVSFAAQQLSAREAFAVHQYGVAANLLSAALRLMRIGHVDTQRILGRVNAGVEQSYQRAEGTALQHMAGFAPLAEIVAALHVKAHLRLFMN